MARTARTYLEIQKQIDSLRMEAEQAKLRERNGVIERIKEAISTYELTAQDLFGVARRGGRKASVKGAPAKVAKAKRAPSQPKFKDPGSEKTWTGMGKRPGWYKDALEAGKTPEDLAI